MEVRNYEKSLDQYTICGTQLLGKLVYYYTKTTRTYSVAKHSLRIYLIKNDMMEVHHANMSVLCRLPYTSLYHSKTGVYRGIHFSDFCSKT